jgi:preprotein translocase subunit YajC
MKNICNYHTKQNKINKTTKTKLKTTLLLKLLFVIVVGFVCCCFDVALNQTNKPKQTYEKHMQLPYKNQQTNKTTFIYILLLLFILVYFIGSKIAKRISKLMNATLEPVFFGSKVAKRIL